MDSEFEDNESLDELIGRLDNTGLLEDCEDDKDTLIIGLDFGTTYSGVAYAFTTNPESIYTINDWPGAKGKTSPKCPTLIKYNESGEFTWGFELDRTSDHCIEAIKLLLDPDQPKPLYVQELTTEAELQKLGKPAIEVATDYIQAIFKHARYTIEAKYPKNYLDMLKKRYVLSVPAVWSDKAKDATLRAARNAGIGSVTLIKEPEAAALFTLHHMGKKGLKPGDAIVLCDAGGGTVDLISYEILKIDPLELKELTQCTGALAGSLMLNKRFEEWIKQVVGDQEYLRLRELDAYRRGMKVFDETIKPGFQSGNDKDEYINFPTARLADNPSKGLVSDTIAIKAKTLSMIFEPVSHEIDRLIREQINAVRLRRLKEKHPAGDAIKAVFLVGGFGSSSYIYASIKAAHPDIQVIQPNDAWSAIVRGAVMSKLPQEAQVTINFAPKHYGVSAGSPYLSERDMGQTKFWDNIEGIYRVTRMRWYIHKGDALHRARTIEFPFYRAFQHYPSSSDLRFKETLFECSLDNAPVYPIDGIVSNNVALQTDLSMVPSEYIKKRVRRPNDGEILEYWQVNYKLLVSIGSGPMVFSITCGGKDYGKVTAEY